MMLMGILADAAPAQGLGQALENAWAFFTTNRPDWLSAMIAGLPVFGEGLQATLSLFAMAGILGFTLGTIVALMKSRYIPGCYWLGWGYVELFRNLPLLVILFFFYYALQWRADLAGLFALTGWASAFMGEVIRGGIQSVEREQIQSARLLGLSQFQLITAVILPQAYVRILPVLANQFMNLAKNTSIVYFVGVLDVTYAFEQLSAEYFLFFHFFAMALAIYAGLSFTIIYLFRWLEIFCKARMQPVLITTLDPQDRRLDAEAV